MKRTIKYSISLILILFFISACSSSGMEKTEINPEKQFKFKKEFSIKNQDLERSPDRMDNYATYQIAFELTTDLNDLYLKISKSSVYDPAASKMLYFIMDKSINTAHFKDGPPVSFIEIYRNYNANWAVEKVDYFKSQQDPLGRLTRGTYRIRFTDFTEIKNDYKLIFYSDGEILIGQ
jgi:hypothetical protein